MRRIQYTTAYRFHHQLLWDTGSPAFAGGDKREYGAFVFSELRRRGLAIPRRDAPELCWHFRPGGRGECRVPAHPAASCAKESTRVFTTGPPERPAFPHAMVLTAYVALLVIGLVCHRHQRIKARLHPAGPASPPLTRRRRRGVRTTRLHRPRQHRSSARRPIFTGRSRPALRSRACPTLPRRPHPAPTFVTMANAPHRDGMAMDIDLIWVCGEAEYFCKWGWTPGSTNCPSGKSVDGVVLASHTADGVNHLCRRSTAECALLFRHTRRPPRSQQQT
jgi:hypothetical protein